MALFVVLLGLSWQGRSRASEERRYALVIGYNGSPPSDDPATAPAPLRFADDDALAFFELRRQLGDRAILLAAPDVDSRRRFPEAVEAAQSPTLAALDRAMTQLGEAMQADRRVGRTTVFSFFYSGHGVRGADGQAALTLVDAGLSRSMLYQHVLDRAPADVMHLFIDACHAEGVVRARDGEAKVVRLSPDDVTTYLSESGLGKYPNLGFVIASSTEGAAHEWDAYQSGVFTHEVISALRGAADINGDRRVEYSELGAFLSSANREVQDPRARLHTIVRAPVTVPRAPIADLSQARGVARLIRIPAAADSISIEDALGNRLAEGRPELGFFMSVALPANQRLFIRRGDREAELTLRPGVDAEFRTLAFRERPSRARGALDSSLRAGLFLAQFGPAYYRGYVDAQDGVAVPVAPALEVFAESRPNAPAPRSKYRSLIRSSLGAAAVAVVSSSLVFAGLAWDAWRDNQSAVERQSVAASDRFRGDVRLSVGFLIAGAALGATAFFLDGEQ